MIRVEHLVKRYNGLTAVNDLTFGVKPGELFGFLGPNGAGKTTTISILCTILGPTSGSASVAGFDCSRQPQQVRRSIGILFQDPSLDERLTAWENLEFHGMIYHMSKVVRRKRMKEMLELVELTERQNSIVRTFSRGMKRRLEIARSLMHRPQVLFLDEPTIGLDPQTRRRIWETLAAMRKETGVTLFLTTHSMEEATPCDRVAIIDRGKLLALGVPQQLMGQHQAKNLEELFIGLTGHDLRDGDASGLEIARSSISKFKRWS